MATQVGSGQWEASGNDVWDFPVVLKGSSVLSPVPPLLPLGVVAEARTAASSATEKAAAVGLAGPQGERVSVPDPAEVPHQLWTMQGKLLSC